MGGWVFCTGFGSQTALLIEIGFQEVTRRGFKESDVKHICDLILLVMENKRKLSEVKKDVLMFRHQFDEVKFGFQSVNEVVEYANTHQL